MSQAANQISTTPPLPGAVLVSSANGALAALLTRYSGASAPSTPSTGQMWIDTSASPILSIKTWDGVAWIVEGLYDTTNHQIFLPIGGGTASIASATTTDLSSVNGAQVTITGVVAITSFGSPALPNMVGPGTIKFVRFSGILTLTNGANLVLPGGANITTAVGDTCLAVYQGAGVWIVWNYTLAGTPAGLTISTEAQAEAGTDNATAMSPLRAIQSRLANPPEFANIIRNGGLEVWQRLLGTGGTTIAVAASTTAYTVDGWYFKTAANQACTITQIAGLTSQSRYACRVQRNNGQTGTSTVYFAMPLDTDELLRIQGATVQLMFMGQAGANWSPTSGTLTYNLYLGTGGGGPAKQGGSAYTGQTNPLSGSVNFGLAGAIVQTFSALSSAVAINATQAELQFSWTPTGTAGAADYINIDDVILVVTPSAGKPAMERLPYQVDLARNQRSYWRFYNGTGSANKLVSIAQASGATTLNAIQIKHPVIMRGVPTITISAFGDFIGTSGASTKAWSSGALAADTDAAFAFTNLTFATATFTGANAGFFYTNATTSWLEFSAEI